MTSYQRLCLATCLVVFGLIVLGGVVRDTNSGLGCPDWPSCHGSLIPQLEKHTLIEYSHRLTATVAGFLILAVAFFGWRSYRRVPSIVYPAVASFVLLIVQAGLGGVTVLNDLPPGVISVHLATALTLLTVLVLTTVAAFAHETPLRRFAVGPNFGRLALITAGTAFGLMFVGSYVGGSGYGLACSGWPLCNGQVIPTTSATSVDVHFMHRLLALVLGCLLVPLTYMAWQVRARAPMAAMLAVGALAAYFVQALIGAAQIWTQLAAEARIAHLAVGSFIWVLLALLVIRVYRVHELIGLVRAPAPPEADLAGATR